ncbi:MAG: hypothetical protein DMG13_16150 [Acidobacteria bacterium]|nr:MAG: hypothetical protein DMG13_16150 [Acidobacteriota bacterium]
MARKTRVVALTNCGCRLRNWSPNQLANKGAAENFNKLAPSYQRQYIGWITTAKKEETRRKRLAEAIRLLAHNRKLGLK